MILKRIAVYMVAGPETPAGRYQVSISLNGRNVETALIMKPLLDILRHEGLRYLIQATTRKSLALLKGITFKCFQNLEIHSGISCFRGNSCRRPRWEPEQYIEDSVKPLERLYTTMAGPIRTPSLSRSQNFVTIIDDCTGFSQIRFLRSQNQSSDPVRKTIMEYQNLYCGSIDRLIIMHRPKVKWVRSDGGRKYVCDNLGSRLNEIRIVPELKQLYSLQSNDKGEGLHSSSL